MFMYLINRVQRIQNTNAGYIFGHSSTMHNVINLHWLPIKRRRIQYDELVHQFLHSELRPKYLLVEIAEKMCSSEQELKIKHGEKNTFQQTAAMNNELPDNIKKSKI